MSTLDNILQEKPTQHTLEPIVKPEDRVVKMPEPQKTEVATPVQPQEPASITPNEDFYKAMFADPTPTQEQLDKEKKKQKRDKIIAAIGDGISAFSNLYFTTQGAPSMYDGKNSQSAQVNSRYDKLLKDRKDNATTYYNGLVKAQQMDDTAQQAERSWRRQLEIDERGREATEYQRERDRMEDERKQEATDYQRSRDTVADEQKASATEQAKKQWQSTFDQNERKIHATATAKSNSSAEKQTKFAIGDGKELAIDNNVWAGSMQQVYDKILNDPEFKGTTRSMLISDYTVAQKEDFVKQNWLKSPVATNAMYGLARETAPQTSNNTSNRPVWDPTK